MSDQKLLVTKILKDLNREGIPTAQVEREIGIKSATYLNKVKRGIRPLNEFMLEKLMSYHKDKINNKSVKVVVKESKVYSIEKKVMAADHDKKNSPVMPKGLSLVDRIKWMNENESK